MVISTFNARPRCRAVSDVTRGCQTTKQEDREKERGERCNRTIRQFVSLGPGKHKEGYPGPVQRLSRATTVWRKVRNREAVAASELAWGLA